jgi:hypothetical protein
MRELVAAPNSCLHFTVRVVWAAVGAEADGENVDDHERTESEKQLHLGLDFCYRLRHI